MDKMQKELAQVIENYFGADAGYLDISCLDLAKRILDAGWEKPVRCKDCKHSEPCICVVCEEGNTMVCSKFLNHVRKDHFCSYGERKDNER